VNAPRFDVSVVSELRLDDDRFDLVSSREELLSLALYDNCF